MRLRDLRTPFNLLTVDEQTRLLEDVRSRRHMITRERNTKRKESYATPRPRKPRRPRTMDELLNWMQSQIVENGDDDSVSR